MKGFRRILRKMNVQLFLSFILFSTFILLLTTKLTDLNWNHMFANFINKDLEKVGYLLIDDMRGKHIERDLTLEQREWLQRRAALFGVLLQYSNKEETVVYLDTFTRVGKKADRDNEIKLPYVNEEAKPGQLKLAYMEQRSTLDPAYQIFQDQLQLRTRVLYSVIILTAVLFSYLIAQRLSRHLSHVHAIAEEIGSGKRDVQIPTKGPEEVRRLAGVLNNMSAELKRQEDWRHHLMEDFMHELRTPLTSVLSRVEAVVDGLLEPNSDQMNEMYEELERLTRLVNDLERLSEAEAARFSMNIQRTNMVELVRRVYNQHKSLAKSNGIRLLIETTNVPCYAQVDRDKIVQVLTNIVLNAIKYTSSGGTVTLYADWTEDLTILACEDTGIGISQQDLPYIFNRLYRADKSRSRFSGGVGLGLSISKALVEAHHGIIEATSKVGYGSRFTIRLPNIYKAYPEEEG
ncbi:sensor histidine kinase [Paenibacillus koleovorans]|uniref:sensor histidine kinase n=1 Tax=Paenibacillus koleovorans TaxID=121608 RepID=UPI000FD73A1A|nr:ATP-binding protein [Paenibacillus koleovorans]